MQPKIKNKFESFQSIEAHMYYRKLEKLVRGSSEQEHSLSITLPTMLFRSDLPTMDLAN